MKIEAYLEGHPEAIESIPKDKHGERGRGSRETVSNNLCDGAYKRAGRTNQVMKSE